MNLAVSLFLALAVTVVRGNPGGPETNPEVFTGSGGNFTDNGGPSANYLVNSDVWYKIEVAQGQQIQLNFSMLDIEANWDFLYVYDGAGRDAGGIPLLSMTSNDAAYYGTVQSASSQLWLNLFADGNSQRAGFVADWTAVSGQSGSSCAVADLTGAARVVSSETAPGSGQTADGLVAAVQCVEGMAFEDTFVYVNGTILGGPGQVNPETLAPAIGFVKSGNFAVVKCQNGAWDHTGLYGIDYNPAGCNHLMCPTDWLINKQFSHGIELNGASSVLDLLEDGKPDFHAQCQNGRRGDDWWRRDVHVKCKNNGRWFALGQCERAWPEYGVDMLMQKPEAIYMKWTGPYGSLPGSVTGNQPNQDTLVGWAIVAPNVCQPWMPFSGRNDPIFTNQDAWNASPGWMMQCQNDAKQTAEQLLPAAEERLHDVNRWYMGSGIEDTRMNGHVKVAVWDTLYQTIPSRYDELYNITWSVSAALCPADKPNRKRFSMRLGVRWAPDLINFNVTTKLDGQPILTVQTGVASGTQEVDIDLSSSSATELTVSINMAAIGPFGSFLRYGWDELHIEDPILWCEPNPCPTTPPAYEPPFADVEETLGSFPFLVGSAPILTCETRFSSDGEPRFESYRTKNEAKFGQQCLPDLTFETGPIKECLPETLMNSEAFHKYVCDGTIALRKWCNNRRA